MRLAPCLTTALAISCLAAGCNSARQTTSAASAPAVSSVPAKTQRGPCRERTREAEALSGQGIQLAAGTMEPAGGCGYCVRQSGCDYCCGGPSTGVCEPYHGCVCF